jgi:hypothetical protein
MSAAFGETFGDEREFALFLGLTTSELPKLGVLLDLFEPGRPIDRGDMAALRGLARHILTQRNLNPPKLPEHPPNLRHYKGGF